MCLNICLPSPVTSERICIFYFFVYFSIITSGGGEVNSWTCLNVKDTLHFSLKWFLKKKRKQPFVNQNSKLRFDQKKKKNEVLLLFDPYLWSILEWQPFMFLSVWAHMATRGEGGTLFFFFFWSNLGHINTNSFFFFFFKKHVLHRWTTCMWIILSFIKTLSQQAGH